jgi:hypothetical protein
VLSWGKNLSVVTDFFIWNYFGFEYFFAVFNIYESSIIAINFS